MTTTNSKTLNGTLTNAGTITVSGSGVISIPNNGTSIVNQAGATINFQSDASILLGSSTLTGTSLVNAGTIKKTAGIATSTITLPLSSPSGSTHAIYDAETGTLSFTQGTLEVDGLGYLASQPAGTLAVGGNLIGSTTDNSLAQFNGSVKFAGSGKAASPQLFEVMGQDLGPIALGFTNNFADASVAVAAGTYVRLVDNADNAPGSGAEALYVNSLSVASGSTLDLNSLHVYTRNAQITGSVINGTVTLLAPGGPITLGNSTSGNIKVATQTDVWTIFGRAGESLVLIVNTGTGGNPVPLTPNLNYAQVSLIDPNGNVLATASNSVSGANVVLPTVTLAADGLYQIKISNTPATPRAPAITI